jgi:hypothetical protein
MGELMAHKSEPGSPLNVALEEPSLKSQTAENVSVAQSSHHSEADEGEVTDTVDLVSLLVGLTGIYLSSQGKD